MQHYSFHIGDYRSATMHLTDAEDLGYRRMLDMYYDTEIPLPDDAALIGRKARVKESVVKAILAEYFYLTDEGWRHYRCDEELTVIYSKSEKARASIAIRWDRVRSTNVLPTNNERNTKVILPVTRNPLPVTQESTTLSCKQDESSSKEESKPKINGNPYLEDAKSLLAFLNERAGRSYPPSETNLKMIVARLKDGEKMGITAQKCRSMLAMKIRDWKDSEWSKYLRPATLFNATKFNQYIGELHHD